MSTSLHPFPITSKTNQSDLYFLSPLLNGILGIMLGFAIANVLPWI